MGERTNPRDLYQERVARFLDTDGGDGILRDLASPSPNQTWLPVRTTQGWVRVWWDPNRVEVYGHRPGELPAAIARELSWLRARFPTSVQARTAVVQFGPSCQDVAVLVDAVRFGLPWNVAARCHEAGIPAEELLPGRRLWTAMQMRGRHQMDHDLDTWLRVCSLSARAGVELHALLTAWLESDKTPREALAWATVGVPDPGPVRLWEAFGYTPETAEPLIQVEEEVEWARPERTVAYWVAQGLGRSEAERRAHVAVVESVEQVQVRALLAASRAMRPEPSPQPPG